MGYWFGGDYNPRSQDEVIADLPLMRELGINMLTIGVFSWSRIQPAPDRWEFGWLDQLIGTLRDAKIGVCLATPTASPPPWFTLAHPEAMPQTREGVRLTHGSRDTYCVNSAAYRSASHEMASQLAARYGSSVDLWHVHNEYGTWCFCDNCAVAFRQWLRERYGSLGTLNEAWCTDFWSQQYGQWEEILPPRATQYLRNPSQEMDYRRFLSDSLLNAFVEQRDAIKAVSSAPVTTNFVLGGWVPVDHARWASEVDLVAIDHYPDFNGPFLQEAAFAAAAARGWAGGRRWLLMEHPPTKHMLPLAMTHIERGSLGALFFQWRANPGGAEQWHPALVPNHYEQALELGARLRHLSEQRQASDQPAQTLHGYRRGGCEREAPVRSAAEPYRATTTASPEETSTHWRHTELDSAEIAVWYDEECFWALQATSHLPVDLDYQATVQQCHAVLERHGYAVDVTPPALFTKGACPPYRLVVVPAAYLLSEDSLGALRDFEASGGHCVFLGPCGVVDEHLRVRDTAPQWEIDDLEGTLLRAAEKVLAGD
ncbi:beta-galactosidase [Allorhizocola rhizosphaerae]|uniref:beta-galactosidase n=1 Tax=Allorhizocola rhizosphaerae TaxID=1872709 RepID=UPI0013C340E2|nr:alpha-amylase family protein [Allorhizocola rhizosphaerae]